MPTLGLGLMGEEGWEIGNCGVDSVGFEGYFWVGPNLLVVGGGWVVGVPGWEKSQVWHHLFAAKGLLWGGSVLVLLQLSERGN